jgi:ribose/xylose/arabinose/galactoside ABC-type transport system permease subunit
VNVERHLVFAFGAAGLLAGVAGVILTARLASAEPLAGVGWELQGIAATVIGGTSFSGGEGTVFGTVMGALIMGVIVNALNLLNIQSYYQQVVTGLVIILAVLTNQHFRK